MLLNTESVKKEIKEETKGYLDTHESENVTIPNLWDTERKNKLTVTGEEGGEGYLGIMAIKEHV